VKSDCAAHLDISRQAYLQTHRLRYFAAKQ